MNETVGITAPYEGPWKARALVLARGAIALTLAMALVIAALCAIGPERIWPAAYLQYLPYPVLVLPSLAVLAASFWLPVAWRVAAAAALAVIAGFVMGFEFHGAEAGSGRVRLMTYNIKDYLALDRGGVEDVAREIAAHDPDIVLLQDAAQLAGLAPERTRALFGGREVFHFGQYYVASRFPLRDCGRGSIPFREHPHSYIHCSVAAHGVEFDVVTAHFVTPRDGLNAIRHRQWRGLGEWKRNVSDRMTQAQGLARDLAARARPAIVAGDLNATQHSLVVRALLATGLRDAFSVAGKGYGFTYGHSLWPGISFLRIDHILVPPQIGVVNCYVGGKLGSPHRPVIADLHVRRE